MYTKLQDRIPQAAPQAPPGALTAHGRFYLVLLCSQPDTVRRFPLRETRLQHLLCSAPTIYGFYSVSFYRDFVKENVTKQKC